MDHPFGVGTGQIRAAMADYIGGIRNEALYVDPHNNFLYVACEYGVVGLLVFIWLLLSLFLASRQIYRRSELPVIYRCYALGMAGLIGALVACNMFYSNFHKDLVMGTLVIHFGMLAFVRSESLAFHEPQRSPEEDGEE
jgi:O-antigen ligase